MLKICAVIPQSSNMSRVTVAHDKEFSIVFLCLQTNAGILKQDVIISLQIPNYSLVISWYLILSYVINSEIEAMSLNYLIRNILPTSGLN
jgi:hypothetical protein